MAVTEPKKQDRLYAFKNHQLIQLDQNQVIKTWDELSIGQLKIAMYAASQVQEADTSETQYTMSFKKFAELCRFESTGGKDYERVYREARALAKKGVDFIDKNGDTVIFNWLTSVRISPKSGTITYKLDEALLPFYKTRKGRFAMINLIDYMPLRGRYAILLYEFLSLWQGKFQSGKVYQTIEQLRSLLEVPEGKYTRIVDFKRRVVNDAVEEINQKSISSFRVTMNEKYGKFGRVEGITFHISPIEDRDTKMELTAIPEQTQKIALYEILLGMGVSEQTADKLTEDYSTRRIKENIALARKKDKAGKAENLPAFVIAAIQEDFAEAENMSLFHETEDKKAPEKPFMFEDDEAAATEDTPIKDPVWQEMLNRIQGSKMQ